MADVKNYLVNYTVNSEGNAANFFQSLVTQAEKAQAAITTARENILKISGSMGQALGNVKEAWNITPTVDISKATASLKELEAKTKEAAARMRKDIATALNGVQGGVPGIRGGNKDIDQARKFLAARNTQQLKLQQELLAALPSQQAGKIKKAVDQLWGKEDISSKVLTRIGKLPDAQAQLKALREYIDESARLQSQINAAVTKAQRTPAPAPTSTAQTVARQGFAANNIAALNELEKKLQETRSIYTEAKAKYEDLVAGRKRAMYTYGSQNKGFYPGWNEVFNDPEKAARLPKFLSTIVSDAHKSDKMLASGKSVVETYGKQVAELEKQIANTKKISGSAPVTLTVTLNTAPAIEMANELIRTIGTRSVTIPVTIGTLGKKPNALAYEDSISKITGKATQAGRMMADETNKLIERQKTQTQKNAKAEIPAVVNQVTNSVKGLNNILKDQPVNIIGKFDGSLVLGQLQETINKLKAYAKSNPILLSSTLSNTTPSGKGEKIVAEKGTGASTPKTIKFGNTTLDKKAAEEKLSQIQNKFFNAAGQRQPNEIQTQEEFDKLSKKAQTYYNQYRKLASAYVETFPYTPKETSTITPKPTEITIGVNADTSKIAEQINTAIKAVKPTPVEIVIQIKSDLTGMVKEAIAQAQKVVTPIEVPMILQKEKVKATSTAQQAQSKTSAVSDKSIATSREKIQTKVNEKPVTFRSAFNGGDAAFQANMARQRIQQLVGEKPVTFRSAFNGGDAAFQANQALARLQQLVSERPVTVVGKFAGVNGLKEINKGKQPQIDITAKVVTTAAQLKEQANTIIGKTKVNPIKLSLKVKGGINKIINNAVKTAKANSVQISVKLNGADIAGKINEAIKKAKINKVSIPIGVKAVGIGKLVSEAVKKAKIPNVEVGIALRQKDINSELSKFVNAANKRAGNKIVRVPVSVRRGNVAKDLSSIIANIRKSANEKKIEIPISVKNTKASEKSLLTYFKQLQSVADKNPIKIRAQFDGGNILTQFNQSIASLNKSIKRLAKIKDSIAPMGGTANKTTGRTTVIETTGRATATGTTGRNAARDNYARSLGLIPTANERVYRRPQQDIYTRARGFFYPLTGNTSFGARTPAMVDMAKGMGTMFAVGGAMSAVGSSLSQAVSYQNTMKTVEAILRTSDNNFTTGGFNNMSKIVRNVGKETKFTAPQVADAARFMAMAGLSTQDINNAIRPVADVALIGDTDLGTTADKLTNVMTTFGLKSEQMRDIADIMTSTFTRSNTDMMMLAESAKYAGGIARLYGGNNFMKTFSDTMAMFGILGNAGIQASSAGTTIRMMYQNLMQPNKKQLAALNQYGIYTRDANGQPLQMGDIIAQMAKKIPQNKMADAIGQMFRITAQPGAATLASNVGKLSELMAANRAAEGSNISGQIANEKKGTLSGLWAQVTSTFTEGVVQAMENREGGWIGMLTHLRDYLADPKTIEMISNIIDLVEMLAKTMASFAKIWAGAYHMFPNLINGWLKIQMLMTQIGYLFTPVIQIIGTITMFKNAILGLTGSLGGATIAARQATIANRSLGVGSAVSGVSGAAAASAVGRGGYAATRFGTGAMMVEGTTMAQYQAAKYKKWRYEVARNRPRNSVMYHGERTAVSPLWYATMAQFGVNAAESNQWMKERSMFASTNIEARQAAARRADAAVMRQQAIMNEQLRAMRRPEQLANSALMMRYATMYGGREGANANWVARGNQIREANAAALAARRPGQIANKELMKRFYMSGGKGAFSLGMKGAFQRGLSMGTIGLSAAGMFGGIKSAFYSLMAGLSKAVGLLVSPVGLAVAGLALLGGAIYKVYNDAKKYKEAVATAEKNSTWATDANKKLQDAYLNGSIAAGGFKPVEIGYKKAIDNSVEKAYSLSDNKIVDDLLNKTKPLAGSDIVKQYTKNSDIYLPHDEITDYYRYNKDYKTHQQWDKYTADYVEVRDGINKDAQDAARKLGIIAQWGKVATEQDDVKQALADLQKALYGGDQKRVREIMSAYRPTSTLRMNNFGSAEGISEITDPTKYYEWQYAQYQALQNMLNNYTGPAQYYQSAVEQIKTYKGLSSKEQKVFDGTKLAQTIIQAVPIAFNGTVAAVTLDNMGRVDWNALSQSVNNGIPLDIQQQYDILQSVYDAIYNDPNIQNVQSLIELLNHYLPEIANQKSPYEGWTFGLPPVENPALTPQNDSIQIPYAAKPLQMPKLDFSKGMAGIMPFTLQDPNDFNRAINDAGGSIMQGTVLYHQRYPERFPQDQRANTPKVPQLQASTYGRNLSPTGTNKSKGSQKDYASSYGRNAARPTQVNITIDKLCSFDRTMIAKNADDRAMMEAIENKLAEAIAMLSASALNSAGAVVAQGLA